MFKRSSKTAFSALAVAAALAVGAGVQPVWAAENVVSAAVGTRLKDATKLVGDRKITEAVVKAKEALTLAKTPFETFKANEVLAYIDLKANDAQGALHSYEQIIDSPYLDANSRVNYTKTLAQLHFGTRSYGKAIEYGQRVLKSSPSDVDFIVLVGQAYFVQKDCRSASRYMDQAIEASQAQGRAPKENYYLIKLQCAIDAQNVPGQIDALDDLVARFPKKEHWNRLLSLAGRDQPDKTTQHIYRLKFDTDTMDTAAEFVEMAQLALQFGYPGEAEAVLERGFSSKVLEKDPAIAERNHRLLDSAKRDAEADKKTLPMEDKEARNQKTGEADVKLGFAYLTYGDATHAVEALERGIGKGGVKSPAEAQIFLGMAYLKAKRIDDAKRAFRAAKDDQLLGSVAKLWILRADQS